MTPSKFLHEFKDNDNFRKDPTPELSIYLPDATIGATNNEKFHVKGKDVSKGLSSKLSGSSEIAFKAHTAADATKWFEVIRAVAGAAPASASVDSEPTSPVSPTEKRVVSQPPTYQENSPTAATIEKPAAIQTSGISGGETVTSPVTATPVRAVDHAQAAPAADKI